MSRWNTVHTTVRFTGTELRAVCDALRHVMDNPDPQVDYAALGKALDKIAKRIGDLNYGRMTGEESL